MIGGEAGCNTAYYVFNDDCVLVNCPENNVGEISYIPAPIADVGRLGRYKHHILRRPNQIYGAGS